MFAAFDAACWAANSVPLRDPRKPSDPELFHDRKLPSMSVMVTIVLLKDACTYHSPCGTCLRSFFLNVFFLLFSRGAAVPPAATGLAIISVSGVRSQVSGLRVQGGNEVPTPKTQDLTPFYVFDVAFFLVDTVPLRGPLRVRALVWVRCPRTGKLRR